MSCTTYFDGNTLIHQLDPRARIIVTFLFSVLMALSWQPLVLVAGLLIGVGLALVARLPFRPLRGLHFSRPPVPSVPCGHSGAADLRHVVLAEPDATTRTDAT